MKKIICLTIVFLLLNTTTTGALSWAYFFVVHDGKVYEVKEEIVLKHTELENMIGKVETQADEYSGDYYGNASNYYESGTRYFKIEGIQVNEAIAVETEDDHYVKAVYVHDAPSMNRNIFKSRNFWVVIGISIVVLVGTLC